MAIGRWVGVSTGRTLGAGEEALAWRSQDMPSPSLVRRAWVLVVLVRVRVRAAVLMELE